MKVRLVIRDTDTGAKALETIIQKSKGEKRVTVGILGADASRVHVPEPNADGTPGKSQSQITMAALGEIFEFGLGNNPERSWLRAYVDANAARIYAMFTRVGEQVIAKKLTTDQGLELIGLQVVGEIKQRIQAGIMPPLAASTLRRKGPNKTTPLIFTSQWIGSITHKVEGFTRSGSI